MAEFRTLRNTYNRETEKNMKVISKLNLTMSNESLKVGGWAAPPVNSPKSDKGDDSMDMVDFPHIRVNSSFTVAQPIKDILEHNSVEVFPVQRKIPHRTQSATIDLSLEQ